MSDLSTDLFDYELPDHLIAQTPSARRDESRLLVVDRASRTIKHHRFRDLPALVQSGDVMIRNNAAVLPARLRALRPTGGAVQCFLLRPENTTRHTESWWCLLKPGKKLPPDATFACAGTFSARVLRKQADGVALVEFTPDMPGESMQEIANRIGEMPLPPYIGRDTQSSHREEDLERYQTVYADRSKQVAVAAPTAGLHFTPVVIGELENRGVRFDEITLHVGLGTFRPVSTAKITDHDIHHELYEIPAPTQRTLLQPQGRRIAVGTTSVRAIGAYLKQARTISAAPYLGEADIFIYPPQNVAGIEGLITNFHQPRSTLLCLVSAFLTPGSTDGIAWIKEIYAEAIRREYRFFSYGDAMLIL